MAESTRPMVLRSVHLPAELDEQLRSLAFHLRRPKADLIRFFVGDGLQELTRRLGRDPSPEAMAKVAEELRSYELPEAKQEALQRDFGRIEEAARRGSRQYAGT